MIPLNKADKALIQFSNVQMTKEKRAVIARGETMKNSDLLELIVNKLNISPSDFETSIINGGISDPSVIASALEDCDKSVIEAFLNGYIILKRGQKKDGSSEESKAPLQLSYGKSVNNVILKKLKIAYSLTNDDLIEIYSSVGLTISKNELTTLFRKEGHKHYRGCKDEELVKFLEGIALRFASL